MSKDAPSSDESVLPLDGEPSNADLKNRVVNATYWSLGAQGLIQGLRMVQSIILARLLFPEAFGAAELVMTIIIGLEMLSDLGIEPSIVQHKRGEEPSFLNTAFTIQAVRGFILFGLAYLCTPLVVWLANDSSVDVAGLVPLAAATAIVFGLMPTKVWLLHRHLDLKRLAILDVASFVVAMVTMIVLASFYSAAWVLILGGLVRYVVKILMGTFWLEGPINRLEWESEAGRDIIHFGKWIFVSTLITFLAERMTILVLPRLTDLGVLGVFSQGNKFAALMSVAVGPVVGQVMLPALAEAARTNRESLVEGFRTSRESILRFLSFSTLGLALFVPVFIRLVYDARYHDAGWMTQLTLVGAWFSFLHFAWSKAVLAIGNSRPLAISTAIKFVATFGATVGGFHVFGVPGLLLGSGLGALVGHLVILVALQRNGLPAWGLDIKYGLLTLVLGLLGGGLPLWIGPSLGPWGFEISQTVIGVIICAPLGYWSLNDVLGHIRNK
ncbi:MAG: oligosaccharide flippase family protein [Myxococcota bacterium]